MTTRESWLQYVSVNASSNLSQWYMFRQFYGRSKWLVLFWYTLLSSCRERSKFFFLHPHNSSSKNNYTNIHLSNGQAPHWNGLLNPDSVFIRIRHCQSNHNSSHISMFQKVDPALVWPWGSRKAISSLQTGGAFSSMFTHSFYSSYMCLQQLEHKDK